MIKKKKKNFATHEGGQRLKWQQWPIFEKRQKLTDHFTLFTLMFAPVEVLQYVVVLFWKYELHRRRIYTESKATSRRLFLLEKGCPP